MNAPAETPDPSSTHLSPHTTVQVNQVDPPRPYPGRLTIALAALVTAGITNVLSAFLFPASPIRPDMWSEFGTNWGNVLFNTVPGLLPATVVVGLLITGRLSQIYTLASGAALLVIYFVSAAGGWSSAFSGQLSADEGFPLFVDNHMFLVLVAAFVLLGRRWVATWTVPLPTDDTRRPDHSPDPSPPSAAEQPTEPPVDAGDSPADDAEETTRDDSDTT